MGGCAVLIIYIVITFGLISSGSVYGWIMLFAIIILVPILFNEAKKKSIDIHNTSSDLLRRKQDLVSKSIVIENGEPTINEELHMETKEKNSDSNALFVTEDHIDDKQKLDTTPTEVSELEQQPSGDSLNNIEINPSNIPVPLIIAEAYDESQEEQEIDVLDNHQLVPVDEKCVRIATWKLQWKIYPLMKI